MDFLAIGGTAYSIRGGIQLEACEVYSDADFTYADMPPSVKAQLRSTDDTRPIFITTMFGLTVDTKGKILPNDDDNRKDPKYKIFKGTSIEALEVEPSIAQPIIAAAGKAAACLEQIKILRKYLSLPDITSSAIADIESKINTVWGLFQGTATFTGSLKSGGTTSVTSKASGFPVGGSVSYTYQARWNWGTLKVKLIS